MACFIFFSWDPEEAFTVEKQSIVELTVLFRLEQGTYCIIRCDELQIEFICCLLVLSAHWYSEGRVT